MQQAGVPQPVTSNQVDVHEKLDALVKRYQSASFQRPVSAHTQAAFSSVLPWLKQSGGPLILDSCCGVGESTARLAAQFPKARVLGVDKSEHRLDKHHAYSNDNDNYRVIRADLNDLWRLLVEQDIRFSRHYLLYPNPYPKASQIQKRWYATALMPYIMKLSPHLEVRSNWALYLEEFALAAQHYGRQTQLEQIEATETALTPFERKYQDSGQVCFRLIVECVDD